MLYDCGAWRDCSCDMRNAVARWFWCTTCCDCVARLVSCLAYAWIVTFVLFLFRCVGHCINTTIWAKWLRSISGCQSLIHMWSFMLISCKVYFMLLDHVHYNSSPLSDIWEAVLLIILVVQWWKPACNLSSTGKQFHMQKIDDLVVIVQNPAVNSF